MLVNICLKFQEGNLNGFWVTERTRPYSKIYYFQLQMDIAPKVRNPELQFLRSARRRRLMLLYICVKFHENISNGFWVTEWTRPYRKIYYFQFQRAITPNIRNPELWSLRSARRLMLLYIYVKFHEISHTVLELQSGHDFVIDRQTDRRPGQKQFQPYGGRNNNQIYKLIAVDERHSR